MIAPKQTTNNLQLAIEYTAYPHRAQNKKIITADLYQVINPLHIYYYYEDTYPKK